MCYNNSILLHLIYNINLICMYGWMDIRINTVWQLSISCLKQSSDHEKKKKRTIYDSSLSIF